MGTLALILVAGIFVVMLLSEFVDQRESDADELTNCPPCNHNCEQGRWCPYRRKQK